MFKRPEELILAVIAVIWLIITFFIGRYVGMDSAGIIKTVAATALWSFVLFILWQKDRLNFIWPWFVGLLIACWWPYLDWLAKKDMPAETIGDALIISAPWYATRKFKLILAFVPVVAAYIFMWKKHRQSSTAKK